MRHVLNPQYTLGSVDIRVASRMMRKYTLRNFHTITIKLIFFLVAKF